MTFPRACVALVALVLLGTLSVHAPEMLEETPPAMRSGTPDRVIIDSPPTSVSADEVVVFEAIIYDPVNKSWRATFTGQRASAAFPMTGCFTRGRPVWWKSPPNTTG